MRGSRARAMASMVMAWAWTFLSAECYMDRLSVGTIPGPTASFIVAWLCFILELVIISHLAVSILATSSGF